MDHLRVSITPNVVLRRFAAFLIVCSSSLRGIQIEAIGLPTIALIPDAWHSPVHYSELTEYLAKAGYSTLMQRLPGCNSELPMFESSAVDAAYIRDHILLPQINQDKEVVLVAHSYGGCPGAVAAKGLSITERREANLKGGIIGLIFICGLITRSGHTLRSMLPGGKLEPWVVDYHNSQLGIRNPDEVFYNDIPEGIADLAIAQLKNQSIMTFETPTGNPGWADAGYDGRRSYLQTSLDKVVDLTDQQRMIAWSMVEWDITTFDTGHCPFLTHPYQLANWIMQEIGKFEANDLSSASVAVS